MASFSFYPTKIVTSGEGGILLTQIKELKTFAESHSWFSRMNEMEAILGLAYFDKLNEIEYPAEPVTA